MLTVAVLGACAALVGGCGGGTAQTAGEPSGTFRVRVTNAHFPTVQAVARPTALVLSVRNVGVKTVPNVAVTLDSFYYKSNYPELASKQRPVWVVEKGPGPGARRTVESEQVAPAGGAQTAYVETWALGSLPPGQTKTFRWLVTPIKPGVHTVHYRVAAGLAGNAKAVLPSGAIPEGHFTAAIARQPPPKYVNPETGKVAPGTYPVAP